MRHGLSTHASARRIAGVAAAAIVLALLGACDDDDGPSGPDPNDDDDETPTSPSVPVRLTFVAQPGDVEAGAAMAPAVEVAFQDSAGEVVTTADAAVTLSLGSGPDGASLGGTTAVDAVDGVATFDDLRIERAGSGYTLVASSGELASLSSTTFAVAPAEAAGLEFRTDPPATAEPHAPISPPVEVGAVDAYGNTTTSLSADVEMTLPDAAGATLGGTTTVAASEDDDGVARFTDLDVDTIGTGFRLVAVAADLSPDTSRSFDARVAAAELAGGRQHTCMATEAGVTYCWGVNEYGEVGDGSGERREHPALVSADVEAVQVAAGGYHACHLTAGGAAACWGRNEDGQLGDGTNDPRDTPTPVTGDLAFASISAGELHSCARAEDGDAYCWGNDDEGQLGDGEFDNPRDSPGAVAGGLSFAALDAGQSHTCGVTDEGDAYCWGLNGDGQLGDGSTERRPEPVAVVGDLTFEAIAAGGNHTCALTPDGEAYCWGFNASGELGVGTDTIDFSAEPLPVAGDLTFARITAGGAHTCGLTESGAAYCWGSNAFGEAGDGSGEDQRYEPSPVASSESFVRIVAGRLHSCGVTDEAVVYCWGDNFFGQLGDGGTDQRDTPYPVSLWFGEVIAFETGHASEADAARAAIGVGSTRAPVRRLFALQDDGAVPQPPLDDGDVVASGEVEHG
ncbi:MAG: RCC1 domain-containing protein [Gemmatimonadota bacterium]